MALLALCDSCQALAPVTGTTIVGLPAGWGWRFIQGDRRLLYCPACLPALDSGGAAFEAVLHDARDRAWRRRWGLT